MSISDSLKRRTKAVMAYLSTKADIAKRAVVSGVVGLTTVGSSAFAAVTCPTVTGAVAGTTACEVALTADFSQLSVAVAVIIAALILVAVGIRALWNVYFAVKPAKMH